MLTSYWVTLSNLALGKSKWHQNLWIIISVFEKTSPGVHWAYPRLPRKQTEVILRSIFPRSRREGWEGGGPILKWIIKLVRLSAPEIWFYSLLGGLSVGTMRTHGDVWRKGGNCFHSPVFTDQTYSLWGNSSYKRRAPSYWTKGTRVKHRIRAR